MKIIDLKVMRGPNIWSVRRPKLIVMILDLEEMEERPTNSIDGFFDRLKQLIPSLYEHRCSEGRPGGFFHRVETGTWMGHVIEHIALEIQTVAGMNTGFGRTRETSKKGVYNVVFSYEVAKAGAHAAKAAVRIAEALIAGEAYDLSQDINELKEIWETEKFGPSTNSIVQEAIKRNIPYFRLNNDSLVQLGFGKLQKRIQATIASTTGYLAVEMASDKEGTKNLLESAEIPVPSGKIIYDEEDLKLALETMSFPIVIKPVDGNHGKGASTNILNYEEAVSALALAKTYSNAVICEKRIEGKDYRVLVINYKFIAAAMRTPAAVIGDGKSTIQELIDIVNTDSKRGESHEKLLTKIKTDDLTRSILSKSGYSVDTVLPSGLEFHLKDTANISTGGTATDVTDIVDPENKMLFERIARVMQLDICGIDIIAPNLCNSIKENGGAVLEVNAAPGFRTKCSSSTPFRTGTTSPSLSRRTTRYLLS
jgi:cyanophycin synthetase